MPDNVHLLTLDRIIENDTTLLLIRLEHALEKDKNRGDSQDVVVDLEASFCPVAIVGAIIIILEE